MITLGRRRPNLRFLKKEYVCLQNIYNGLKDEHESLLPKDFTKTKVDISITCDLLDDMPYIVASPYIASKFSISVGDMP